jgi:hypothetical protein
VVVGGVYKLQIKMGIHINCSNMVFFCIVVLYIEEEKIKTSSMTLEALKRVECVVSMVFGVFFYSSSTSGK